MQIEGYRPQSDDKIALVNVFKQHEERLNRLIDQLRAENLNANPQPYDGRLLALGATQIELGFMGRIALPEDAAAVADTPDPLGR